MIAYAGNRPGSMAHDDGDDDDDSIATIKVS